MPFMAANSGTTGPITLSPRDAAEMFFKRYPLKRKCSVAEGYPQGEMFVSPMRGRKWFDITRETINVLPDISEVDHALPHHNSNCR